MLTAASKQRQKDLERLSSLTCRLEPLEVYRFIRAYIELCTEGATKKQVSEKTNIIDTTPFYEDLEEAIVCFSRWQRAFWRSEIERYRRNLSAMPKVEPPPIVIPGGL